MVLVECWCLCVATHRAAAVSPALQAIAVEGVLADTRDQARHGSIKPVKTHRTGRKLIGGGT